MDNAETKILTIIIPCYNAEKYLERCTRSFSDLQEDISIIFINDGSTDLTRHMIQRWVDTHQNSILINKENGGYSSAINAGLNNCRSEYVMYLGSDDEIVSAGINKICDHLKKHSPDILCFSTDKVYDDVLDQAYIRDSITQYHQEGYYEMSLFDLCKKNKKDAEILFTRDTSRCFRMSIIADLRYFGKTGVSADGCFSSIVASRSHSFEFVNERGYVWHLHKDSVSAQKKNVDKLIDEVEVWERYFQVIQDLFPDRCIPPPIIYHILEYKRAFELLKKTECSFDVVYKHKWCVRRCIKWALKSRFLSIKLRIALLFPSVYLFVKKILKRY